MGAGRCRLPDGSGFRLPLPHRRTFAAPLLGPAHSMLPALRHPCLRWPATPAPGAAIAESLPSCDERRLGAFSQRPLPRCKPGCVLIQGMPRRRAPPCTRPPIAASASGRVPPLSGGHGRPEVRPSGIPAAPLAAAADAQAKTGRMPVFCVKPANDSARGLPPGRSVCGRCRATRRRPTYRAAITSPTRPTSRPASSTPSSRATRRKPGRHRRPAPHRSRARSQRCSRARSSSPSGTSSRHEPRG